MMYSSKSARSALPLFALAPAVGVELGMVGSWVSTVAASAASLALAFTLALAFGRGRVEGAIGLKVVSTLVMA